MRSVQLAHRNIPSISKKETKEIYINKFFGDLNGGIFFRIIFFYLKVRSFNSWKFHALYLYYPCNAWTCDPK